MENEINFNDFKQLLINLINENNEIRSKAENQYESIAAHLRAQLLLKAISDATLTNEIIQLCAVLLRRLFFSYFDFVIQNTSPEVLEQIKSKIIHLIRSPCDPNLKKKICDSAAELSKRLIDENGNNHWPEFLNLMFECVDSNDFCLKECALNILNYVPGILGNQLEIYLGMIKAVLYHSLSTWPTTNLDIKTAAAKATSSFVLFYEQEKSVVKSLTDCVLPMIQLVALTLPMNGEHCDNVLKSLVDLAEKCPQFLRSQFDALIQLCLKSIGDNEIIESRRHLCIELLISMAENAPSTIRKRGAPYLGQLISYLLLMMTNIEEDPSWSICDTIEEDDFESNNVIGETSLDRLACSIGGKTILPLVINNIPQMLQNNDWRYRYAAMMAVSAVGEGCHDQMLPILPKIVEGILPFLSDSHPRVRYSACNALGQMATDFAQEFQKKFHGAIIPKLLLLLDDYQNPRVQAHAASALVNFFEECSPKTISTYIDMVAAKLEEILNLKMKELIEKGTKLVLEQTIVTLASLADAAQEFFEKYYDKFVPCLKYIIEIANTSELKLLRGKAIECLSLVGLAVGKEKFCNDASDIMNMLLRTQTGEEQLADDDPQLNYMISAWARICKILGSQFEPYLPFVMPPVLRAASITIQVALLDKDEINSVETDNDWQCISLGDQQTFGIKTAGLEEKATACQMLVCYARELEHGFANYVEETFKIMVPLLKFHFHDGVRTAAAESMPYLLKCAKVHGNEYLRNMWKYIFPELVNAIENESDREVLCELMTSLETCIATLGREFLTNDQLEAIVKVLDENLRDHFQRSQQRLEKRKDEDYDEGLEETLVDEDEEDVYILGIVADVLHTLFVVCKEYFLVYFDKIAHHFVNLACNERSWPEQHWAVCVMDDVIEHAGPSCEKYKDFFLPLIANGIQSVYPEMRQASAYGWGVLAQFGGIKFASECSGCVSYLLQMVQSPDSRNDLNINATENAIAALTKILQYNNSQINFNELLPIWFSLLPVWADEEELPHVYGFLLSLIEINHPLIIGENNSNLPRIVYVIMETITRDAICIKSMIGQKILAFLNSLKNNALLFSSCVEVLNPQQQEALRQILT